MNFEAGTLAIMDPKNKALNRTAFLTKRTSEMLQVRKAKHSQDSNLIFPSKKGTIQTDVSKTFPRTVNEMFNQGITDPRQKVCFHTLRHSFASWLVQRSVDLYSVKELMGHATFKMTQRYSHLSPEGLRRAAAVIEIE